MFTNTQIVLLVFAALSYLLGGFSLFKNHRVAVPLFLFISGVFVFSFAATLDDFLNIWDERFHILVAKNMIAHPFKPMLYADPILNTDYNIWANAHVWLHKQPLFMWQMALSMKLFGANVFAARLPGVILSATLVVALYRSGKLLSNRTTGFFAATLMLTSFYWMEMVSGRQQLDQNDVAFIGYISLSIWAFIEYYFSRNKCWLVAIGVFSGFAILCKWLVGLLVYFVWGISILFNSKSLIEFFRREWMLSMAKAFFFTMAIAAPWQIYIALAFPKESALEHSYTTNHLWEAVEGHGGEWNYYINLIPNYFNVPTFWLIVIAFLLFLYFNPHRKIVFALTAAFVFQLLFFSTVSTKMPSFAMAGWFIGILALAFSLQLLINFIGKVAFFSKQKIWLVLILGISLWPLRLSPQKFKDVHAEDGLFADFIMAKKHNKALFQSISLDDDYVLFNVNGRHYVEAMFYLGIPVYNGFPTEEQIVELDKKQRRIAVLSGTGEVPGYIKVNPSITIIEGFTYVHE